MCNMWHKIYSTIFLLPLLIAIVLFSDGNQFFPNTKISIRIEFSDYDLVHRHKTKIRKVPSESWSGSGLRKFNRGRSVDIEKQCSIT